MYSGLLVEEGSMDDLFRDPRHPYTRGLFGCIPDMAANKNENPLAPIRGQLPLVTERPRGCFFGPRCDFFEKGRCDADATTPIVKADGRAVRCVKWREIDWERHQPEVVRRETHVHEEEALHVENVGKDYELPSDSLFGWFGPRRQVKAVQDFSMSAKKRETVAIVGESGCGKSTFAKMLMGLEETSGGEIVMGDDKLSAMPVETRGEEIISGLQMVFQNPNDTLNPVKTVGEQISRSVKKFGAGGREDVSRKVDQLLDLVKLPRSYRNLKPSQLSGGQKQRIGIARAFAGKPELIVADEPVSALDVSVQAAVINLLLDIQDRHDTTLLFISHDLSLGSLPGGPDCGDVFGADNGAGGNFVHIQAAVSSVHGGAAVVGSDSRLSGGQAGDCFGGGTAVAVVAAGGVSVFHALSPPNWGGVRHFAAADSGFRRRSQNRLPHG